MAGPGLTAWQGVYKYPIPLTIWTIFGISCRIDPIPLNVRIFDIFFSSGQESNYKSLICGSETVALKEQTRCGAGNVALLQREVRMVPDHLLSLILFRYQGERTGIKDRVSAALGIQVQK